MATLEQSLKAIPGIDYVLRSDRLSDKSSDHVPFILLGGTARHGHSRTGVTPADIAPTLARFAGVRLPKAEGKPVVQ